MIAIFGGIGEGWGFWLFLLLAFCIALHLNLSGADIKHATRALPLLLLLSFLVNFMVVAIFPRFYSRYLGFFTTAGYYLVALMLLALLISLLLLLFGLLLRGILNLLGGIRRRK